MSFGVTVDFNANLARFTGSVDKAVADLNRFQSNADRISAGVTKAFGALGVGLSVAAVGSFIKSTIDAQDHLNDLSKTTLISVEALSGLSLAAKQSGSDLDGTAAAINKLAVNMGKNSEKFAALGITAKDPLKAFGQFADVFNQIEDPQKRAALGAAALGKSWQDAVPLLSEGSKKMNEMIEKGAALSGVTKESAKRADEFNDRLAELERRAGGWGVAVADPVIKALIKISDAMGKEMRFEPGSIGYFIATGGEMSAPAQQGSRDTGHLKIGSNKPLGPIKDPAPTAKPSQSALDSFIGGESAVNKAKSAYDSLTKSLREKISVQDADLNSTFKLTDAAKEYAKFLSNVVDGTLKLSPKQLTELAPMWDEFLRKADALQGKQRDIATAAARLQIGDLQQGFAGSNASIADGQKIMSESGRRLADSLRAVDEQGRSTGDVFRNLFNDGKIDADQYNQLIQELTVTLDHQKEAVASLEAAQQVLNSSWSHGASRALQIYLDDVGNVAKQSEALFTRSFRGMEDALVEFSRTGKLNFTSLANQIISDMIRMQIQAAQASFLSSSGGGLLSFLGNVFGGGGSGGGSGGLPTTYAVANGDVFNSPSVSAYRNTIVSSPTLFKFAQGGAFQNNGVMGEAGPEAVMPLTRINGKLGVRAQGGGGGVVVNIIEAPGGGGKTSQRNEGGQTIIDVMVEKIKSSIAGDITRGNGAIPGSMERTYGLSRMGGAY